MPRSRLSCRPGRNITGRYFEDRLRIIDEQLAVEISGAHAAGVNWDLYRQTVMQYLLTDKNNVDTSALRTLDRVIVQAFEDNPTSQEAWPTLLALARARRALGYADYWTLLEALRHSLIQQDTEARFIEALAAEYLAIDLPWTALTLLSDISPTLSSEGRDLRNRIEKLIDIIREDAAYVTPNADLYAKKSDIEKRFLDLLGIPPYALVGSYLTIDLAAAVRRDEYGLGKEVAALATGTPVVGAFLHRQPSLDFRMALKLLETQRLTTLLLSEDQKRAAEQIIRNASSSGSMLNVEPSLWRTLVPLLISQFATLLSESRFDWMKWRDSTPQAKNLELVGAAHFSDGVKCALYKCAAPSS